MVAWGFLSSPAFAVCLHWFLEVATLLYPLRLSAHDVARGMVFVRLGFGSGAGQVSERVSE